MEAKSSHIHVLLTVIWMVMIICEMKKSIQSVLSELRNGIFTERTENRLRLMQKMVLSPETKMSHNIHANDAILVIFTWTIDELQKQADVKSFVKKKNHKKIETYDYFWPKPTKIFAYPTSIRMYVEDVLRTPYASQVDLMRHEWARYQTYGSFPKTCKVSPIKLSRAGFYYTGIQDQTSCFSCEFKYQNWRSEDSPMEIHRQMSPDCTFLKGSESRNVAIERDHNDTESPQRNGHEIEHEENGASGGVNESYTSAQDQYSSQSKPAETTARVTRAQTNELNEGILLKEGILINDETSDGSRERRGAPDIRFDRAKHPHYATLSNRLASFTGWLGQTTHTPHDLASAGLYYVGTGDCVRCFFCGGGLRCWQNGDDPYTEHARWYPECGYIQIYQGDEHVHVCSIESGRSPAAIDAQSVGNAPDTVQNELERNALSSTGAQCILSMGYSIETVTHAIELLRLHQERSDFTAEQILELILEKDENQSSNANSSVTKGVNDSCQRHADAPSLANNNKDDFESMLEENRELKEQMTCKICMDAEACIVFLPCSHMMTCAQCSPAFRKCPICRAIVRGTVRAFKS